eukprot:8356228-Pyramimonas_sp.AAC.1
MAYRRLKYLVRLLRYAPRQLLSLLDRQWDVRGSRPQLIKDDIAWMRRHAGEEATRVLGDYVEAAVE